MNMLDLACGAFLVLVLVEWYWRLINSRVLYMRFDSDRMFAWSVQFFWRQFMFALNTKQSWLQEIVNVGWFVILTSNAEQMLTQVPGSENAWVIEIHQKDKLFHTSTGIYAAHGCTEIIA